MLGWMILFAFMAVLGFVLMGIGYSPEASVRMATSVFAFLFLLTVLTRAMRMRVW